MAGPSCRRVVGLAGEVEMASWALAPGDSGANEKDGSNSDCLLDDVVVMMWSHLLLLLLLLLSNSEVGRFKLKVENAAPPAVPATGPCHEGRLEAAEGSKVSSGVGQSLLLMTPAPALLLPALMRWDRADVLLPVVVLDDAAAILLLCSFVALERVASLDGQSVSWSR